MKQTSFGFTLVEISIVMIIVGLLIGGTFGGMKLIENMQVNKTVQDLKAIESAALTFRDTYGRLPGDLVNPAARLPNCTVVPCATAGNGDRILDATDNFYAALSDTKERFTFWHHLQGADMLAIGTKNTVDMTFGEGQPSTPLGGGFRISDINGAVPGFPAGSSVLRRTVLFFHIDDTPASAYSDLQVVPCSALSSVDTKMDDGRIFTGSFIANYQLCPVTIGLLTSDYRSTGLGNAIYDLKGF